MYPVVILYCSAQLQLHRYLLCDLTGAMTVTAVQHIKGVAVVLYTGATQKQHVALGFMDLPVQLVDTCKCAGIRTQHAFRAICCTAWSVAQYVCYTLIAMFGCTSLCYRHSHRPTVTPEFVFLA